MPTMPPTPWLANTSRVSSTRPDLWNKSMQPLLIREAMNPMSRLSPRLTNPAAGVMATKPTTAPMHAPTADILRSR